MAADQIDSASRAAAPVVAASIESFALGLLRALVASAPAHSMAPVDRLVSKCAGTQDAALGLPSSSMQPKQAVAISLSEHSRTRVTEGGHFHGSNDRGHHFRLTARSYKRFARLFAALDAVHKLSCMGRSATQRELFYKAVNDAPALFRLQKNMDDAVQDVVGALRIGRPHLGIFTTEKGLVAGAVRFHGQDASPASNIVGGSCGVAIGEAMLRAGDESIDVGSAHCILVIEKDCFFQRLLQGRLSATLPVVFVTGRGYPDLLTRRLLQRLQRVAPQLPQLYMGDYDPHGVSIFLVYRASCPALRWLGLHQSDVERLPSAAALPFTRRDRAVRASLLRHPDVIASEAFTAQVRAMDRKFELEALHAAFGADEIAQRFVPDKILRRAWI